MRGTKTHHYGVVIGDLVQSQTKSAKKLHAQFNKAIDAQNTEHTDALASPLTITLGDEFQGLTHSLKKAVSIVRDLRLELMNDNIDCRFVIGLVELETAINPDRAWNMMSPGLARARSKLNEKNVTTLYRFSIAEDPHIEIMLDSLGAGLTLIERGWTDQQRNDISALMSGLGPGEIAKRRNVSVHSIYKVRGSGNYRTYMMHWNAINEALDVYDRQKGLN